MSEIEKLHHRIAPVIARAIEDCPHQSQDCIADWVAERVARELCNKAESRPKDMVITVAKAMAAQAPYAISWQLQARAVIGAMREPTSAMCVAGTKAAAERYKAGGPDPKTFLAEDFWHGMIDAALSDSYTANIDDPKC